MTEQDWAVSRRTYLAGAGAAGLAGVSGCLEFITGDAAEFEASPSRVPQDVLDQTGYEFDEVSEQVIEEEFEAGGETRDVIVTNKMAEYDKPISIGEVGLEDAEAAIFTSLTTPQVEVLGEQFNPIDEMSTAEIVQMVQDQYDEIEAPREEDSGTVTVNGEQTTQTKFRADAVFEGNELEMFLHVTEAVEMGDDFVVTVGGYPELTPGEEENIITMMESVEPDD